jgi:hypothetical protein
MSDIVERLRSLPSHYDLDVNALCGKAADEIERLRERIRELGNAQKSRFLNARDGRGDLDRMDTEIERLRAALQQIANRTWNKGRTGKLLDYDQFASAALK